MENNKMGLFVVLGLCAAKLLLVSTMVKEKIEDENKGEKVDYSSAMAGILPNNEVTLDTLVGRSLDHIKCTEGEVEVRGINVHYWRYESTKATKSLPPVVGLHGGPAATHNYIRPLLLLADEGHPVIFYDQAGCGASRKGKAEAGILDPKKDAPWLLTIEYYVEEL
jgi:hypothetical protein